MPLLVAGLAIPSSLALVYVVAQQVEMSIFVLNIATMLGLALAIDYSLFIVSRYREELRRGRSVGDAVERAVATAGKAVAFSGLAVAIGLSGLLLFAAPAIRSIGIAGALVVLCSVVFALTFLPGRPRDARPPRQRAVDPQPAPPLPADRRRRRGRRGRVAGNTSRAASCAARSRSSSRRSPSCSSLGIPFLRLEQGVPGAEIYPPGVESRDAYVALQTEFAPGETTPIIILADVAGLPDRASTNIRALDAYAARVDAIEGIDRVESPFTIHDPATGTLLTPEQVAAALRAPRGPAPGRRWTRSWPSTCAAPRSASTRSARCRPRGPAATSLDPADPRDRARATGSRRRSAAAPRSATTSWCRRRRGRRTRSA